MAIKKKAGDSIWIDVTGEALSTVDETWANWTGSWAIVPALGSAAVLSGAMTKGTDIGVFRIRIGATAMAAIPAGSYILVVQVENSTVDYVQEIAQEKLTLTAQGIV